MKRLDDTLLRTSARVCKVIRRLDQAVRVRHCRRHGHVPAHTLMLYPRSGTCDVCFARFTLPQDVVTEQIPGLGLYRLAKVA